MNPSHQTQRTLVSEGNCKIELCECGTFSASIGPVTVRLDEGSTRRLAACIERALQSVSTPELQGNRVPRSLTAGALN